MRGVLDTSVFIAREQGRPLACDRLPEASAISAVTVAELRIGVHLATTSAARTARVATFRMACSECAVLPVDASVAEEFADLVARLGVPGWRRDIQDLWVATTARAHRVAIYTQDADFDGVPGLDVVRV